MSSKTLHRLAANDTETRGLLAELQRTFIRTKTPIGAAIYPVVSAWHQEKDGSLVVQFSPLAADQLPALSGLALLRAARALAEAPEQPSGQDAA
jgi:hypothetical protein